MHNRAYCSAPSAASFVVLGISTDRGTVGQPPQDGCDVDAAFAEVEAGAATDADQLVFVGRILCRSIADLYEVKPFARQRAERRQVGAASIEMQRVDDDAGVVAASFADQLGCFVQRADAGPGDEFEAHRQTELLRQGAQLTEEIADVGTVVAPRAAEHMLAAQLRRRFHCRQVVPRLRFLDDSRDLDVEQLDAGGGERGLRAGEQRSIRCERMDRFVTSTDRDRSQPDECIACARGDFDELRRRALQRRQMSERELPCHQRAPAARA